MEWNCRPTELVDGQTLLSSLLYKQTGGLTIVSSPRLHTARTITTSYWLLARDAPQQQEQQQQQQQQQQQRRRRSSSNILRDRLKQRLRRTMITSNNDYVER